VAIATLAVFAGAGGLGAEIYNDINFKTGIVVAGSLAILIAILFDLGLVLAQRWLTPWRKARAL
jgi:osmoprotectant transport system permease protein